MTGIRCNITTTTISASIAAEVTSFIGIASRQEGPPASARVDVATRRAYAAGADQLALRIDAFLEWAALNHPKTFLGLMARAMPYHLVDERPKKKTISREEALGQLQEHGLRRVASSLPTKLQPQSKSRGNIGRDHLHDLFG